MSTLNGPLVLAVVHVGNKRLQAVGFRLLVHASRHRALGSGFRSLGFRCMA